MRAPTGHDLTRDQRVRQAIARLSFGSRPGYFDRVSAMGVDRWIDQQLAPETIEDSAADRVLATLETQRKQVYELIADHPEPQELQQKFNQRKSPSGAPIVRTSADSALLVRAQQSTQQLANEIMAAKLVRAVASERQLLEVMTDFWENHFSVYIGKMPTRYSLLEYDRDIIRPRALGKFRDLLGAVAKSPEMLVYLDNAQSGVDSLHPNVQEQRIEARRLANTSDPIVHTLAILPHRRPRGLNENYGRELMELHTLGVDGGYTQTDVQEVARALSGWTLDMPQLGGGFVFRPELHDAAEKVVLGHKLPAGRGIEDGEEVLDILARAPATARFISTKLARRFVSDDPPAALVERCAETFRKTDGDIRQTVRCIVTSPEFFSPAAYRTKVKTPFELVASTLRVVGAAPDTTPRSAQIANQLGQPFFGRVTPDGWPDRGEAWMNSGAIMNRINFGQRIAADRVPGVRLVDWTAMTRLRKLPVDAQVSGVIDEILGGDVSNETRQALTRGENPMVKLAPQGGNGMIQLSGLPAIVGLALGSPEFQRR
jgi:uncharacterized protein (DUF1800 family)